jgi:hypothetical protein
MVIRRRAVLVAFSAMLVGRRSVFLRFSVATVVMMVRRLTMMMSGCLVVSGCRKMMLARLVLGCSHWASPGLIGSPRRRFRPQDKRCDIWLVRWQKQIANA